MKNKAGNNNSSSNSQNYSSNNSSNGHYALRDKKEEEYAYKTKEKWGGTRAGAGRKPNSSNNMQVDDPCSENSDNSSIDNNTSVTSRSATKREACKRETARLSEIEKETCRTKGSGLTVETCLIVISLFTQRIRDAISGRAVDDELFGTVIDYETEPPRDTTTQ